MKKQITYINICEIIIPSNPHIGIAYILIGNDTIEKIIIVIACSFIKLKPFKNIPNALPSDSIIVHI